MARITSKIKVLLILLLLSSYSFAMQKLTTTQMRKNSIRINALEIIDRDIKADNVTVVLDQKSLNFDFDKSRIHEEDYQILENLKDFIEEKDYKVTIVGYTDSVGSEKYNLKLSKERAEAVRNKLIEFGLSEERIIGVEGKGESEPIDTNSTEEGRRNNRRVEFQLVRD